ncbi:unnamed protein product [Didymodactylos carnosus]|uniref:Uncharacterized protein n=1 Tax=Didymodactylos carnosus TaxID=1234261 RepID=A0A814KPY5_9BILA|nr:unnamed protein product [Didymodactylos carnosus]CAF3824180.1 unnamed protein product [Didymodactylos carnosus]
MAMMESIVGEIKPKPFVEQRRRSIIIDYLLSTSTHGLRGVGRAYSTCNRFFWVGIFTIASSLMLYFVVSSVRQYFTYATQTSVEIRLDRKMPFPAVTICNANPYRLDTMNASLVAFLYRQLLSNITFNQNLLNPLAIPLVVDLFNRNQTEELWSIGFQLSDILLGCVYNGIDCSNSFTRSLTSALGNCFTFNWQTSTPFFTLADLGNTLLLREGLQMIFYVPRETNFPVEYFNIGLNVLLHDNDEFPLSIEKGLFLAPGLSYLITYRKSTETFLPSPYSQCTSDVSSDLRALYKTTFADNNASDSVVYSESACHELCEQAYIFSQCSCILPIPFFTRKMLTLDRNLISVKTCNPITNEFLCAFTAKQQLAASDQLQTAWCSYCTSQCKYTYFTSDLSSQAAPSETEKAILAAVLLNASNTTTVLLPNDFAQRFDYYMDRNYLRIEVACGSKYVTEYKQVATLPLIDMFASIGGQTGL